MLKARLNSFRYAFKGIADLLRHTPNARIHLFMTCCVLIAGFFFGITRVEWCILILCIALVFAAEAANTAIEYLTDLVSPEYHQLAGKTKDAAAAAVLLAAIGTAIVGIIIFAPYLVEIMSK